MLQAGNTVDPEIFTQRLIDLSPDEHREKMMTIAEQLERIGWEKGRMRGREEGWEKGREESEAVLASRTPRANRGRGGRYSRRGSREWAYTH
jgi:hypothetical protein